MDFWHSFSNPNFRGIVSIINASPDSFYSKSTYSANNSDLLKSHIDEIIQAGAAWIDLGAESSKPGSVYIDYEQELELLLPVLRIIRKMTDLPISIDTRKEPVFRACFEEGASILNDISALQDDTNMMQYLARHKIPVVLMHMQGNPQSMQLEPRYTNCVQEVSSFLQDKVSMCRQFGINKIIVDPGIGFGKSYQNNVDLLRNIEEFKKFECPILIGASRKKFLGAICKDYTGQPQLAEDRLAASLAATQFAFVKGANFVRVHDTKENCDVLKTLNVLEGRDQINV